MVVGEPFLSTKWFRPKGLVMWTKSASYIVRLLLAYMTAVYNHGNHVWATLMLISIQLCLNTEAVHSKYGT